MKAIQRQLLRDYYHLSDEEMKIYERFCAHQFTDAQSTACRVFIVKVFYLLRRVDLVRHEDFQFACSGIVSKLWNIDDVTHGKNVELVHEVFGKHLSGIEMSLIFNHPQFEVEIDDAPGRTYLQLNFKDRHVIIGQPAVEGEEIQ